MDFVRLILLLLLSLAASPAAVISSANGSTLAGGTLTATWADNSSRTFAIQVLGNATGSGRVSDAGFLNFSIDNSTLDNTWSITNNRTSNLVAFTINLTNAIQGGLTAIFDSGATPAAPGSNSNVISAYGGSSGVRAASGGTISGANFTSQYTGDGGANMFRMLAVSLGGGGLTQNATFQFNADTDLVMGTGVPEGSMLFPTIALLAIGLWRRGSRG